MSGSPPRSIRCIICSQKFTGKGFRGSYKRHLENTHITRYAHQCKACLRIFAPETNKDDVKEHCKSCTPEDWGSKPIHMEPNLFGSAFTGACFTAKQHFIEHVLKLSNPDDLNQPTACYIRKLYGLLEHGTYRKHIEFLSQSLFGDGWRALHWDQDSAAEASKELEYFDVTTHGHPYTNTTSSIQTFLLHLLFKPERMHHGSSELAQQARSQRLPRSEVTVHPPMLPPTPFTPPTNALGINQSHLADHSTTSPATNDLTPPREIAGRWTSPNLNAGARLTEPFEPLWPSPV